MAKINLNSEQLAFNIWSARGVEYSRLTSCDSSVEDISVHFDNLEEALVREIEQADVVLGCVAWLTNERILTALVSKDVSIVVQKEDFLRPDMSNTNDWKSNLRRRYEALQFSSSWNRTFPVVALNPRGGGSFSEGAIRCMGNYNRDKSSAFPRMHHKFAIFAKKNIETHTLVVDDWSVTYDQVDLLCPFTPYAVWTGSFNFTQNAVMSLENAVVIRSPEIVYAYFREYAHVFGLSEPIDWTQDWVSPEYDVQYIFS